MLKSILCVLILYGVPTQAQVVFTGELPWGIGISGSTVVITGKPTADSERFDVNVADGTSWDYAMHFNPRILYRYVVINSKKRGIWQNSEKVNKMPFKRGKEFNMTVVYTDDGYKISVNDEGFYTFKHRVPMRNNYRIIIRGSVEVSDIQYSCMPDTPCVFGGRKFVDTTGMHYQFDHEIDGGNWIIVQRRTSGEVEFNRDWIDYYSGFGDLSGEFWFGLENIHQLCFLTGCELRIDMVYDGNSYYQKYANFTLSNKAENYKLHLSSEESEGDAGDSLGYHNGQPFSSFDRDNDAWERGNCASKFKGGWWFGRCFKANLNGEWDSDHRYTGLVWRSMMEPEGSVSFSEMKVRPTGHLEVGST